jgi:SAM-dependent methyltransferase
VRDAKFTGERLPGDGDPLFAADIERHLAAYRWAARRAAGRSVLDAGCGEGYGARLLADGAASVVGIDRPAAVATARRRHARPNLTFEEVDLGELATLGRRFEMVVSFQVIEHVEDPVGYLRALATAVAPGGTLAVTTPNRLMSVGENPYHLREWTAPELLDLARPVLPSVRLLGVHGSERVVARERARGEQIARILRLDPLGLRRLLPSAVVQAAFARLATLVRRRVAGSGGPVPVDERDFRVDEADLERALDLLLLAEG